jgi:hypothetical protein
MHQSLTAHWWPKALRRPDLRSLLPRRLPRTHGAAVDALARRVVGRRLTDDRRDAVLSLLGRSGDEPLEERDELVRWRLPYVIALILDAPEHEVR